MSICAIALGSNLGDSWSILEAALSTLAQSPGLTLQARSLWYQTAAVTLPGSAPQPDYLNGCAQFHTTLSPLGVLQTLLQVETQFGRVRRERWGPRTLDLDLLLFDDVILNLAELQLPHPRMTNRAFVLVPLAEIAPNWVEPISQRSITDLTQAVDCSDVKKFVVVNKP